MTVDEMIALMEVGNEALADGDANAVCTVIDMALADLANDGLPSDLLADITMKANTVKQLAKVKLK